MRSWSYDMWSLGTIMLELLSGFPIWMSFKCRTESSNGRSIYGNGIFGASGRGNKKIIAKQIQVVKNLKSVLKKYDSYGLEKNEYLMDLVQRMLDLNPMNRISPEEALRHPFMQD
jgi:serine/threonine protein kinase